MPISVEVLRAAAARAIGPTVRSLSEARSLGTKTVFLCHSHRDVDLARGLVTLLAQTGWRVYIDWADTEMPAKPDRETAMRIQEKIVELQYFLFLATANSMASRWCPWEIGYADGKKPIERIVIVPTVEGGRTHGKRVLAALSTSRFFRRSTASRVAAGADAWWRVSGESLKNIDHLDAISKEG